MRRNLANILTYSRIAAVPVVVGLMFLDRPVGNWAALGVYTYACVTDFLDGYVARSWGQVSSMGRFLDPIADKLLVAAVLIMAAGLGVMEGVHILAAAIILCREILVSGLREFLAGAKVRMPVSQLAKWKTTVQMLALGFLIVNEAGPMFGPFSTTDIGVYGAWIAALVTLITGIDYLRAGLRHIRAEDAARAEDGGP